MMRSAGAVLSTSRREALAALIIWLAATCYTVWTCWRLGYDRDWETVSFVWGFPDWIFWGVVCPWVACVGVSWWFAYRFMRDVPLDHPPPQVLREETRDA